MMFAKIDQWDKKISYKWNLAMENSPWKRHVQIFSNLLGPDIWASIMMIIGIILALFFNKEVGFYLIGCLLQSYFIFLPLNRS